MFEVPWSCSFPCSLHGSTLNLLDSFTVSPVSLQTRGNTFWEMEQKQQQEGSVRRASTLSSAQGPQAQGTHSVLSPWPTDLTADLTASWPSSFLLPCLSPVLQASQGLRSPVSVHILCLNKRQLLQLAHCHLDRHCGFHHSILRSSDDLFMSKIHLFIDSSLFFVHFQFFILSLPWYWEDTHKF